MRSFEGMVLHFNGCMLEKTDFPHVPP